MNNQVGVTDARNYAYTDPRRTYFPSPSDWRKHPVYQVVVDRFNDGDPRNNAQADGLVFDWQKNEGPFTGYDVRDLTTRQGGDWRGLAAKLDYIRGLGCRAMWISPVQQNLDNSPMGYLQVDKTLLERRFGNLSDFHYFVGEAHARGMYVVVDIVNNHLSEMLDWVSSGEDDETVKFRMHHGGALSEPSKPNRGAEPQIRPKAKVRKACMQTEGCDPENYQPYVDFHYNNTWYDEGKYPGKTYREAGFAGMPLGIPDINGTGGYWNSSFHHSGEMPESEEGPWNWPLGKLYGTLDDLRTTDDAVVDKLIAASVSIIAALDVDGFRLDTPRECAYTSWIRWRTAVDAAAKRLGKENFGTWGELWSTPERAATYMGRGKDIPQYFYDGDDPSQKFINPEAPIFDGLINYNYYYWLVTVLRQNHLDQSYMVFNILEWETTMGYDIEWPPFPVDGTDKVPRYQMWNFCGSHDQHRMPQFPMGYERLRLCYAWLYAWPGIPITYQGDEQALSTPGSGLAYWGREFMASSVAWSTMPTQRGPDGELRNPASANNFDPASDYYRFYRRMLNVRDEWWDSAFACLGDGPNGTGLPQRIECVDVDGGLVVDGVFGFRRSCVPGGWGVVMLLNLENATRRVRCDGLLSVSDPGTVYNVVHQPDGLSSAFEYQAVSNLQDLTIGPFEAQALVNEVKAMNLNVDTVQPRHDSVLALEDWLQQKVEISFTESVAPNSINLEIDGMSVDVSASEVSGKHLVVELASLIANAAPSRIQQEGVHKIRVLAAQTQDGARALQVPYEFRVRVAGPRNPLASHPLRVDHDIISIQDSGEVFLEHTLIGAEFFRAQHADGQIGWDRASAWQPLNESTQRTRWENFKPGVPIVVQYHVDGSAAYIVTGCRVSATETCSASYYRKAPGADVMAFKGELNSWLESEDWTFSPPTPETGDHNWTIDVFISEPDSEFLIDVRGDNGHLIGRGNDVTNPFFFPFETFCFGGLSHLPSGAPNEGCDAPLPGPLSDLNTNLCACDMKYQTLFLAHSGLDHTQEWMLEHFPEYWSRSDEYGRPVRHGPLQYIADASSGLYNVKIPRDVCPVSSSCRITFNDITMSFVIGLSPPGVAGLGVGSLDIATVMCAIFVLVPIVAAAWSMTRRRRCSVVTVTAPEAREAWSRAGSMSDSVSVAVDGGLQPQRVLVASIEHIITHDSGVEKAVAGGLGKVAGLLCDYHPGPLVCVHACMPGKSYHFMTKEDPVTAVVRNKPITCTVYKYERPGVEPDPNSEDYEEQFGSPPVTFYIVDHQMFRDRGDIYPTPQTSKRTLEFYSVWNQAVARLIDRVKPDMYHCPDFHAAMAMMYVERPIPIVVVLHNAEYQGAISTQHMGQKEAKYFGEIFDLPAERIRNELFHEGKFSMLKPAIDHARTYQAGFGICAVSRNYALEAAQKHAVLWGLPEVRGIENCMPETERMLASTASPGDFAERKKQAKLFVQEKYGLTQNPDARIFVFVGRWVKQKGVDYIADVAEWMLSSYADSQLIIIGPVGDPYGSYAKEKLEQLNRTGRYSNSLYVKADFMKVPAELKLACDFCLMPSRDEPFGYVDIEFGWYGAVVVGSLRGGLGKLPGFYFQILNSDSSAHMQRRLKKAICKAMDCNRELLDQMSAVARMSSFPVEDWQCELSKIYGKVMDKFDWEAVGAKPPEEQVSNGLATIKSGQVMTASSQNLAGPAVPRLLLDLPGYPYAQDPNMPYLNSARMHSHRSNHIMNSARSQLYTTRSSLHSHRSTCSGSSALSVMESEMESNFMGGGMIAEDEEEFLHQEITEAEVQARVERVFHERGSVKNAAGLLEEVEWDMEIARERGAVSKRLGCRIFGAPVMDWIICMSYITGPLIAALPISLYSEESLCYFVVDPVTQALSLIVWTFFARYCSPNRLMAVANLSRLILLALPILKVGPYAAAVAVGLLAPADYLFIFYSFMGSSVGDIAKLAIRTGFILAVREEWEWVFKGSEFNYKVEDTILGVAAILFSILPAIALLNAPKLYREFRVPTFEFSWIWKLRFLQLLGLGCLLQSLSHVSDTALPTLRQTAPFHLDDRMDYFLGLGVVTLVPIVFLALVLRRTPSYAMVVIKGLACFSMPAVLLRCWAQYEINHSVELTFTLDVFIYTSAALGSISVYAVAVSVLATVGSRWRFVTYTAVFGVLSNLGRVLSYVIISFSTGEVDPLNGTWLPQDLAWKLFYVALPPCALATVLRASAFLFFDKEATSMLRTTRQRRLERFTRSRRSYQSLKELLATNADTSSEQQQQQQQQRQQQQQDGVDCDGIGPALAGPRLLGQQLQQEESEEGGEKISTTNLESRIAEMGFPIVAEASAPQDETELQVHSSRI